MKKNKTVWKNRLVSLCFASLLFSSTPSCTDYKEKTEQIVEHYSKRDTNQRSWWLFDYHGLNLVKFSYLPYVDDKKVAISVFGDARTAKFQLMDSSINGFGNLDAIYVLKGYTTHKLNLTPKENRKFKEFYSKVINKFYSQIHKQELDSDWISVFEKKLKNYYQEKDEMKDLLEIVENHKI